MGYRKEKGMQDRHIALRHEAPTAKGEGIPVARVGALKVLRTWVLRTFAGLFPLLTHAAGLASSKAALICYIFKRPKVNQLGSNAESDESTCYEQ